MQVGFNIWKSIAMIHHINRIKIKQHDHQWMQRKHLIRSNTISWFKKILNKLETEECFLNLKRPYVKNPQLISYWWKLEAFLLKLGTRLACLFSLLLFNIVLEVLTMAISQENKKHLDWKYRSITVLIHIWNVLVCRKS